MPPAGSSEANQAGGSRSTMVMDGVANARWAAAVMPIFGSIMAPTMQVTPASCASCAILSPSPREPVLASLMFSMSAASVARTRCESAAVHTDSSAMIGNGDSRRTRAMP